MIRDRNVRAQLFEEYRRVIDRADTNFIDALISACETVKLDVEQRLNETSVGDRALSTLATDQWTANLEAMLLDRTASKEHCGKRRTYLFVEGRLLHIHSCDDYDSLRVTLSLSNELLILFFWLAYETPSARHSSFSLLF